VSDWKEDVRQDINAMLHAKTIGALEATRRAMIDLHRWTGEAQRAFNTRFAELREKRHHCTCREDTP